MEPFKNLADANAAYSQLQTTAKQLEDRIFAIEQGIKPDAKAAVVNAVQQAMPDSTQAINDAVLAALGKVGHGSQQENDSSAKPQPESTGPHRWDKVAFKAIAQCGHELPTGVQVNGDLVTAGGTVL